MSTGGRTPQTLPDGFPTNFRNACGGPLRFPSKARNKTEALRRNHFKEPAKCRYLSDPAKGTSKDNQKKGIPQRQPDKDIPLLFGKMSEALYFRFPPIGTIASKAKRSSLAYDTNQN